MPKVNLTNNRLVFDGGRVYVKARGNDGKIKVIASVHQPVWLGEDDNGPFVAYAKNFTQKDPNTGAPTDTGEAGTAG